MLSLYYDELMGNIEKHEGTKYLMVDDYMLDKVINKIKEIIGIKKFDRTKILVETENKLPDDITLKNVVILITCVIKDGDNFNLQLYLEEALVT